MIKKMISGLLIASFVFSMGYISIANRNDVVTDEYKIINIEYDNSYNEVMLTGQSIDNVSSYTNDKYEVRILQSELPIGMSVNIRDILQTSSDEDLGHFNIKLINTLEERFKSLFE